MKIVALMMLLGALVGFLLPGLSRGKEESPRTPLSTPPERAIEILGLGEVSGTYFRTESGVYACRMSCSKVTQLPDPSELCRPASSSFSSAPSEVIHSFTVWCRGGDGFIPYNLVLLKDGRAFKSIGPISNGLDVIMSLMASCIGGAVGLIVGMIIGIAMSTRKPPARNSGQLGGHGEQ